MAVTAPHAADSRGLTEAEAAARLAERGPLPRAATSRSYRSIVRANTLTVFNGIVFLLMGVSRVGSRRPRTGGTTG